MLEFLYTNICLTYLHDLNPFAIQFGGGFGIRWYGLSYLMGFGAAFFIISYFAKRKLSPLSKDQISDFVFTVAIGTLVGGRLGYCIFYSPELFTSFSKSFPFWGVLEVNKGGMASHGGIIGVIIACLWFAKKHKLQFMHLLDLVAVTGPLGIFFGRIANFINGELFGRETAVSWAVKFPQEIFSWPTEKLLTLSSVAEKLGVSLVSWQQAVNQGSYQVYGVLERILSAVQSDNTLIKLALEPLLTPRHPSQLYEALAEGLFLFIIIIAAFLKFKKPGTAFATSLIIYPIARIICEQYRMPDLQIGFQMFGLTRGQWLSVGMMVLGLILTVAQYKTEKDI